MSLNKKRWLLLAVRYLIAVVIPLVIFAIKFQVFHTVESVSVFGLLCLGLVGLFAIKGIVTGTAQNIPSKYAYVGKMLQFPFLLLVAIAAIVGIQKLGPQMLFTLEVVLIFNILNMPFTIWYNKILYELYGDEVTKHIEAGVLDGVSNYFKNKDK